MVPWATRVRHCKRHLDQFSRFCRDHKCVQQKQTDRQTTLLHPTPSSMCSHRPLKRSRETLPVSPLSSRFSSHGSSWPEGARIEVSSLERSVSSTLSGTSLLPPTDKRGSFGPAPSPQRWTRVSFHSKVSKLIVSIASYEKLLEKKL